MGVAQFFDAKLFISATITLIVIMDPPGTVPVFLSLVGRKPMATRVKAARQAVLVSLLVITLFAVAGQAILAYLGIGIPALQGAGGLLLLLIALQLLNDQTDTEPVRTEGVNIAFVPLGTPLLAGPGAIAAVIVFVNRVHGVPDALGLALGVVGIHLVLYLTMRFGTVFLRLLGRSGVSLVTRISGLLLSAIAVQLIADSVRAFVEGAA
jgi:multiple antibiotic resistance protein